MSEYNNRDVKERPETSLNGFSRRSALLHVSEEAIKPVFGKDYFGIELSKTLNENEHYYQNFKYQINLTSEEIEFIKNNKLSI